MVSFKLLESYFQSIAKPMHQRRYSRLFVVLTQSTILYIPELLLLQVLWLEKIG